LDVIVVASLLEKVPNLAHLTRTCEVFGASALVLPNRQVVADSEFKIVSVSAEKWLPLLEVKEQNLMNYLLLMKQKDYQADISLTYLTT